MPLTNKSKTLSKTWSGFFLTLPALIVILVTVAYPLAWALKISLSSSQSVFLGGKSEFVGLDNYIRIFSSKQFISALLNTLGFVVATIAVELILGFAIALLLNQRLRGSKGFQVIFTLPLMIAPVVAGMEWRWLFADQYGIINTLLSYIGIQGPVWMAEPLAAKAAVLIANIWLATPFVFLVLLAGLSSLPEDLYEAAKIDGANAYRQFVHLTLPLLRPTLLLILVVRLTDALRVFDIVYILTNGGPGGTTEVLSSFIYKEVFTRLQFGGGTAAAFIVMLLIGAASLIMIRLLRAEDGGAR